MSKLGAHIVSGSRNGYGPYCESKPAVVLAVEEGGALQEARSKSGGHTYTIYRHYLYKDAPPGIDQTNPAGARAMADEWYPRLREKWRLNSADFYTTLNEPGGHDLAVIPNYVAYEMRMIELANADGYKLCVLNLAWGTPDDGNANGGEPNDGIEVWKTHYVPVIRSAFAAGMIYGRHGYGQPEAASSWRPFQEAEYLRSIGLHGGIVITELGINAGDHFPGVDEFMRVMTVMDVRMMAHPNVIGGCLWTLGQWTGDPNWQDALPAASAYNLAHPTTKWQATTPPTPPPSSGVPLARTKYTRITVLIHPTDGAPFAQAAAAASWQAGDPSLPHFFTIGASADDAGVAVLYESGDKLLPISRYVIAVNPERWGPGDDGRGLQGFFETYYGDFGGVNYVPVAAATPADLARILENFDPDHPAPPEPAIVHIPISPILNQRDPRWAAVVMGTSSDGKVKTLGNWGCLDVAYTMLAKQMGVSTFTPDQMWAHFKAKGATSGPNLLAGALATAFPDKVKYEGHQQRGAGLHERIMRHLDGGVTVPARVDFVPATPNQREQHWVLIDGYDPVSGRFRICDPWHGDEVWADERYDITGDDILEALFYAPKTTTPTEPPYKYNGPAVTFSPALHQPGSDWEWARPQAQAQFTRTGLPVKWLSDGVNADYWSQFNKPAFHLVRIMWKPDRKKTPAEAWNDVKDGVLRFYNKGARRFELHNEPNLAQEGWGMVWSNPDELGAWLREWAVIIRQACPLAKLYFPGLSPGVPWTNQFAISVRAWASCKDLMNGFAMHAYTGIADDQIAAANEIVSQVKELQKHLNLQVPLVVSEASVNRAATPSYKARVYKRIEASLRGVPGIEAVCWYISSWEQVPADQAPHQESWAAHGIGDAYAAA